MSWEIEIKPLKEELEKHLLATGASFVNFDFQEKELHIYSYVGPTSCFSRIEMETENPVQFSIELQFLIKFLSGLKDSKVGLSYENGILKFKSKGSKGEIICTPWEGQEIKKLNGNEEFSDATKDAIYDLAPKIALDKSSLTSDIGLRFQVKDGQLIVLLSTAELAGISQKEFQNGENEEETELLLDYCDKLSKLFDKNEDISIKSNVSTLQVSSSKRTVNFPLIKIANGMTVDNMVEWIKQGAVDKNEIFNFKIDSSFLSNLLIDFSIYMPQDKTGKFCVKGIKDKYVIFEANSSKGKLVKPINVKADKDFQCYVLYKDLTNVLKLFRDEIEFHLYPTFTLISQEDTKFILTGYAA